MPDLCAAFLLPVILWIVAESCADPLYLTTEQLCRRQARYVCESHVVQTGDGYLLSLHRLYVDNPGGPGPPVLVQHGLFMGSDIWLLAHRNNSLGFLLAEEGYDVWLGNMRGNAFARNHTTLSPEQKAFWTFTWHEMGVWDVPATVQYIARSRGDAEKLRYVGHSMGSMALLVACSELPGFCPVLRGAVLMAPGAFLSRSRGLLVTAVMRTHDLLWDIFYMTGHYECMTHNRRISRLIRMCDYNNSIRELCDAIYDMTLGHSYRGLNKTLALTFFAHIPTGSSIYTVDHFTQLINTGKFQQYDRSISGRINKPSTQKVAEYDLSKMTIPTAVYYSQADTFVDAEDVLKLSRKLPNVITLHEVDDPNFDHLSFIAGNNVKQLLYDKILANLRAM